MLPYYPFFWGDYSAKTAGLSQSQNGAYMLFLKHIYCTGEKIHDKEKYRVAMAFSDEEREAADFVLEKFFKFDPETKTYDNEKCREIIAKAEATHKSVTDRGAAGGKARAKKISEAQLQAQLEKKSSPASSPVSSNQIQIQNQIQTLKTPTHFVKSPNARGDGVKKIGDLVFGAGKKWKVIDITGQLSGLDIQEVQRAAPGWDVEHLAKVYIDGINSGRPAPNSISKAFPKWCEKYTKGLRP